MSNRLGDSMIARRRAFKGQAMVEMALVITLFLAMVIGIMEFGSAFMVTQAMISAAREGARFASVQDSHRPDYVNAVRSRVVQRLQDAGGQAANARVEVRQPVTGPGDNVIVTITLPYRPITGANLDFFLGSAKMNQGITLVRQVTMRQES